MNVEIFRPISVTISPKKQEEFKKKLKPSSPISLNTSSVEKKLNRSRITTPCDKIGHVFKMCLKKIADIFKKVFFCCNYENNEDIHTPPLRRSSAREPEEIVTVPSQKHEKIAGSALTKLAQSLSSIEKSEMPMQCQRQPNIGNSCYMNAAMQVLETAFIRDNSIVQDLLSKDLSLQDGETMFSLENRLLGKWFPISNNCEGLDENKTTQLTKEFESKILFKWSYLIVLQAKKFGSKEQLILALTHHRDVCFSYPRHSDFKGNVHDEQDAGSYLRLWLRTFDSLSFFINEKRVINPHGEDIYSEGSQTECFDLQVPFPDNKKNLIDILKNYFTDKEGAEPSFFEIDGKLEKKVPLRVERKIMNAPDVLTIQLKRYKNNCTKIEEDLRFGFNPYTKALNLSPYFLEQTEANYLLIGIIVHAGSVSGGHYWAFAKDSLKDDKNWNKCNDEEVLSLTTPEDRKKIPRRKGYIFIFKKV